MRNRFGKVSVAMACCVVAGATLAQQGQKRDYNCQVTTVTGARGLVTYLTTSREKAQEMVVGLEARTTKGNREIAETVVECIERFSDEKFSDAGFDWWITTLEE